MDRERQTEAERDERNGHIHNTRERESTLAGEEQTKEINRQMDRETDRQTGRQAGRQADRQTDRDRKTPHLVSALRPHIRVSNVG